MMDNGLQDYVVDHLPVYIYFIDLIVISFTFDGQWVRSQSLKYEKLTIRHLLDEIFEKLSIPVLNLLPLWEIPCNVSLHLHNVI